MKLLITLTLLINLVSCEQGGGGSSTSSSVNFDETTKEVFLTSNQLDTWSNLYQEFSCDSSTFGLEGFAPSAFTRLELKSVKVTEITDMTQIEEYPRVFTLEYKIGYSVGMTCIPNGTVGFEKMSWVLTIPSEGANVEKSSYSHVVTDMDAGLTLETGCTLESVGVTTFLDDSCGYYREADLEVVADNEIVIDGDSYIIQ